MRYRLRTIDGPVEVTCEPAPGAERAPIELRGERAAVETVRAFLNVSLDLHGYRIGATTTPADLAHALDSPHAAHFVPMAC